MDGLSCPHPPRAIIRVDRLLLRPRTQLQRRKLDDFEGESYAISPVTVIVQKDGTQQWVEADVFPWNGDEELSN